MSTTTKPRQRAARAGKATAYRMYVDGKFVDAKSGKTFDVYDPASEEVMATCPAGGPADVDRAAKAAHRAFYGGWKTATAQERGRILLRLAERVRARRAELAELETRNSGKPIAESEYDMDDTATCFEYYGGLATKINGEVLPVPADAVAFAMREPMGVAGQIIPWNYPLMMAAWKIAPALAAGCTVVLKPAEQTPLSILELAKDFEEVGLPPGVVNIVTGDGPGAGAPLVAHPEVRKIAFTGSAEVGKLIMRNAADQLKRVSLELGGKSPNIFFSRRRLRERGGRRAVRGVREPGRGVLRGQRVLVQRDIYRKFVDAAAAKAKTIKLGNGLDRANKMGPLVSAAQRDRVVRYQKLGREEAKVAAGGGGAQGARPGLVRRAHDLLRRGQRRQDRAGGDLRAGDERDPVQGRGRGAPDRQRDTVRVGCGGVDARHLQGVPGGEGARGGDRLGEPHAARRSSRLPGAATRHRALAASWGTGAWRNTSRPSRSHQPRREADRLVLTYTVFALTNSLIP